MPVLHTHTHTGVCVCLCVSLTHRPAWGSTRLYVVCPGKVVSSAAGELDISMYAGEEDKLLQSCQNLWTTGLTVSPTTACRECDESVIYEFSEDLKGLKGKTHVT